MKLSIIIPIYNEADVIENTIKKVNAFCMLHYPSYEVICVNDGSDDESLAVLKKILPLFPKVTKIVSYDKNKGKGYALRKGFRNAKGDIIVTYDADSQHNLENLTDLVKVITEEKADIAAGSRALSKKHLIKFYKSNPFLYALIRDILSRVHVRLCNTILSLNIKDSQCGFKAIKREAIENTHFKINGYEFDVELLAKAKNNGFKIIEVPVETRFFRRSSKLDCISDSVKMFIDLLRIKADLAKSKR